MASSMSNKYRSVKKSALKRGIQFTLSLEQFKKIKTSPTCFYTGLLLHPDATSGMYQPTLDRVDNSKGYVPGNVVICSKVVNFNKGNLNVKKQKLRVRVKIINGVIVKIFKKTHAELIAEYAKREGLTPIQIPKIQYSADNKIIKILKDVKNVLLKVANI